MRFSVIRQSESRFMMVNDDPVAGIKIRTRKACAGRDAQDCGKRFAKRWNGGIFWRRVS